MATSREIERGIPVREDGYTLFELLVVLTIMGLMIAVAPALIGSSRPNVDARSAALALADDMRTARTLAIGENREVRVAFEIATGRYVINPGNIGHQIPSGMVIHFHGSRGEVTRDTAAIRFFPDGSSTGAELRLSYKGREHRVDVHWINGRISVDE